MAISAAIADLIRRGVVITDGAWGTQLQARGLPVGACPDVWNLTHPDLVAQVPAAYVAAGSQVILTNTFRANSLALCDQSVTESVADLNAAGVKISKQAAAGKALVFASIGPSGKMLLAGDVTEEQLQSAFAEQAAALAAAGADALVIETMTDLDEAKLAIAAAKPTGLTIVACMVFDSGAERDRTMMGVGPEQAAKELTAAGADIIGANCGQGIEGYLNITKKLRAGTDRPLWIKANAGSPQLLNGEVVYPTAAADFASYVPALVQAGAAFLGGCCGTSPDFIQAVAQVLKR